MVSADDDRRTVADLTPRLGWKLNLVGLAIVVGLPFAAHHVRQGQRAERCALNGSRAEAVYRVDVLDHQGEAQTFCSLHCAALWVKRQPTPPRRILLTDETTGEQILASEAHFVRSSVVTTPVTGNRIHVFRTLRDAEKHAARFQGTVLTPAESPFHRGVP